MSTGPAASATSAKAAPSAARGTNEPAASDDATAPADGPSPDPVASAVPSVEATSQPMAKATMAMAPAPGSPIALDASSFGARRRATQIR